MRTPALRTIDIGMSLINAGRLWEEMVNKKLSMHPPKPHTGKVGAYAVQALWDGTDVLTIRTTQEVSQDRLQQIDFRVGPGNGGMFGVRPETQTFTAPDAKTGALIPADKQELLPSNPDKLFAGAVNALREIPLER